MSARPEDKMVNIKWAFYVKRYDRQAYIPRDGKRPLSSPRDMCNTEVVAHALVSTKNKSDGLYF